MRRREFITLLGVAAAWLLSVRAQQPPGMQRVGYVGIQPRDAALYMSFRRRMAELGYQEGRNFTFDYIQTPSIEGYERGYRELAARKVDIFLAVGGEPALRAAQAAAGMLPIAFLAIDFDPAAKGYVDRIARGGKPAEMPIEQTTRFHLTVNLKTAASLNVSLSHAFTARANEVFE